MTDRNKNTWARQTLIISIKQYRLSPSLPFLLHLSFSSSLFPPSLPSLSLFIPSYQHLLKYLYLFAFYKSCENCVFPGMGVHFSTSQHHKCLCLCQHLCSTLKIVLIPKPSLCVLSAWNLMQALGCDFYYNCVGVILGSIWCNVGKRGYRVGPLSQLYCLLSMCW